VDNADDLSMTQPYLPLRGNGNVLLTTRASAAGWLASSLEVDAMGVLEGAELLLRRAQRFAGASDEEINEAMNLVLALGQFPLALDQAGAYIEETGCSVDDYLQLYQTHRQALLSRRGRQATGYPAPITTTWALSFQQVEATNPGAADLLRLCAFLAPDHIPEELLTEGAPYWPPALQEAMADRFRFNQMLETLQAFSLIKRLSERRLLSMHRLVQVVQMERMEPEEQRQWAERVVSVVNFVFPRDPQTGVDTWPQCQRYLEQAQASDTLIQQHQILLPEAADVLDRTGLYLRERGLYHLAEPLLQRALAMREQRLGPEHPDVAASLNHLAVIYEVQGRYKEAEGLSQQAVRMCEQLLGPEHPDVAVSLAGLAYIYEVQGKYTEAESLYQRAIAIDEKVLGPEHPELVIQLYNLANLYSQMSKPAQAEPLFLWVLRIWEDHLGPEHPKVAMLLNNLATLYFYQGKYAQAEPLFLRALRIDEQHLGPEHPETAFPLLGRAGVASAAGNYEEGECLARQALRIWEEHLGPEHPFVAYALWGLANISARQGRASHAEALFERALRIREQQLGETHLRTALVLHDFAGFRHVQGQTQEAAVLYHRALTTRERILGPGHPLTADTRTRLLEVLAEMDQRQETAPTEGESDSRVSSQSRAAGRVAPRSQGG
jgi:tetratricopeptide (TPR) repeat protein